MHGLLAIPPPHALAERWRRLRDADPFTSLAAAAVQLEVAEAELVASRCGDGVIRLDGPFGDLVRALPTLGRVRAITRNGHATMETRGVYPRPEVGCAGVAGEIGTRFEPEHWRYGYALDEGVAPDGTMLVFYDPRGEAVHEMHAEAETDRRRLAMLIELFASFDQSPGEDVVVASPHRLVPRSDAGAWLRNAENVRPVAVDAVGVVLDAARRDAIAVSVAVRSRGVVQRFSGLLHDVATNARSIELAAPWMRLRADAAALVEAWVVRAPTLDGPSSSLEVLDAGARVVLSVSAARWPGKPEPSAWRDLVERLPAAT
jgi:putative hemin transport protein